MSVEGDGEAEELVEEKCVVLEGIAFCEWDVSWLGCACHAKFINDVRLKGMSNCLQLRIILT